MFFANSETEAGELYNGGNGRNDDEEESSVPEDDVENKDEEDDDMDVCSADREDEDDDMADGENGAEAIMPQYRKETRTQKGYLASHARSSTVGKSACQLSITRLPLLHGNSP